MRRQPREQERRPVILIVSLLLIASLLLIIVGTAIEILNIWVTIPWMPRIISTIAILLNTISIIIWILKSRGIIKSSLATSLRVRRVLALIACLFVFISSVVIIIVILNITISSNEFLAILSTVFGVSAVVVGLC